MKKTGNPKIDLLIDICKSPKKYARCINTPCHQDAARALLEYGFVLPLNYLPIYMRKGNLYNNDSLHIATTATRNYNLN